MKCSIKDTKKHDFTRDKTIRVCGDDIKYGETTMDKAKDEQNKLAQNPCL